MRKTKFTVRSSMGKTKRRNSINVSKTNQFTPNPTKKVDYVAVGREVVEKRTGEPFTNNSWIVRVVLAFTGLMETYSEQKRKNG